MLRCMPFGQMRYGRLAPIPVVAGSLGWVPGWDGKVVSVSTRLYSDQQS
jgi:hypothetical protein